MTKAEKTLWCRHLLSGGPRTLTDDEAGWLMREVFPLHYAWESKRGPGVQRIEVRPNAYGKTCGFWLVRADGSEVDISYRVCLNGPGTSWRRVADAARHEVADQIVRYIQDNPPPFEGAEVDHVYPFHALLKDWLAQEGLTEENVPVVTPVVGFKDLFADRAQAVRWQTFHRERASYQYLTAEDNRRKSGRLQ